jgi:hypothetical protein
LNKHMKEKKKPITWEVAGTVLNPGGGVVGVLRLGSLHGSSTRSAPCSGPTSQQGEKFKNFFCSYMDYNILYNAEIIMYVNVNIVYECNTECCIVQKMLNKKFFQSINPKLRREHAVGVRLKFSFLGCD